MTTRTSRHVSRVRSPSTVETSTEAPSFEGIHSMQTLNIPSSPAGRDDDRPSPRVRGSSYRTTSPRGGQEQERPSSRQPSPRDPVSPELKKADTHALLEGHARKSPLDHATDLAKHAFRGGSSGSEGGSDSQTWGEKLAKDARIALKKGAKEAKHILLETPIVGDLAPTSMLTAAEHEKMEAKAKQLAREKLKEEIENRARLNKVNREK